MDGLNYLIKPMKVVLLLQETGLSENGDETVGKPDMVDPSYVVFMKVKSILRAALICRLELSTLRCRRILLSTQKS